MSKERNAFHRMDKGESIMNTMATKQIRKTSPQKQAFERYRFAVAQEERYLGSVFANAHGQREHEAKVKAAYEDCKQLGMGVEHGL